MKGVILSIAPSARIVDITHNIPPQDVLAAALCLESLRGYFPPGVIHLAVVDPGVGTDRNALAIKTDQAFLVGPDNGIFTCFLADQSKPIQAVRLNNPAYHLPHTSATFHGRDIFAPVAAHLASETPLEQLGDPLAERVELQLPHPVPSAGSLTIHILRADHFGNLITDLKKDYFDRYFPGTPLDSVLVRASSRVIEKIVPTYHAVPPGRPLAYFGSTGRLEVAVNLGNAAQTLGLAPGDEITLEPAPIQEKIVRK